jgi:hypothetical protein
VQRGDSAFRGSVPELYDAHLGPLLFEPYAADIAKRVQARPARSILETPPERAASPARWPAPGTRGSSRPI